MKIVVIALVFMSVLISQSLAQIDSLEVDRDFFPKNTSKHQKQLLRGVAHLLGCVTLSKDFRTAAKGFIAQGLEITAKSGEHPSFKDQNRPIWITLKQESCKVDIAVSKVDYEEFISSLRSYVNVIYLGVVRSRPQENGYLVEMSISGSLYTARIRPRKTTGQLHMEITMKKKPCPYKKGAINYERDPFFCVR